MTLLCLTKLLIANDNTKINENCNIITNNNNAALIGANIIDESSDNHEAFIGVRENDKNAIVAKFNIDNILFKVDAIFEENILHTLIHSTHNRYSAFRFDLR